MAKKKNCLENVKLNDITLFQSSCELLGIPPRGEKGLIKASTNVALEVDEKKEDKLSDFGLIVNAKLEGYDTEEEEDASSETEVFKASCSFRAWYSVIKGTEKKENIEKLVPLLESQLAYIAKGHLDYLMAKMNLSGSLVPIPLHRT